MKTKTSLGFILLLSSLFVIQHVLACSSTSEDFRIRSLIVNVQPTQPILVQRYQAPNLRIFCFSTTQTAGVTSASCPSSTATSNVVLCSRLADQPDSDSSCERFDNIGSMIERGSINGPNKVWDIMWDGSSLPAQCFPRGVQFSYLALVRGTEVASIALFVVLLIIAILAVLLGVASLGVFVRQRVGRYDSAGAVTMAGPKGNFAGHQMQVRGGAAEEAQASYDGRVPTMYLPVRSAGASSPVYGADGQELNEAQLAEMAQMNAEHGGAAGGGAYARGAGPQAFTNNPNEASRQMRDIAKKGASPPRPGDAIEGFEGATRDMDFVSGSGKYLGHRAIGGPGGMARPGDRPGDSMRRRRGDGKYKDREFGERRSKALFPTHYDWEKNDGFSGYDGQGNEEYGNSGRPDRFDRNSSGHYVDENGNAYTRDGQPLGGNRPGVRYIPQWMHAFHGRDENENGDAFDGGMSPSAAGGDDGLNSSNARAIMGPDGSIVNPDGSVPIGKSKGLQVSELGVYNKPKATAQGNKGINSDDYEGDGYESDGVGGSRKVRFAGDKKGSATTPGGNGNITPRGANAAGGKSKTFGGGGNNNTTPGGPAEAISGSRAGKYSSKNADPSGDRFNRDRASTHGKSLQLPKNRDFVDGGGADGVTGPDRIDVMRRFEQEDYTTTVLGNRNQRPPVLQCAHCKALLDANAARFCPVTGERHV
jgi:hypothetical protein